MLRNLGIHPILLTTKKCQHSDSTRKFAQYPLNFILFKRKYEQKFLCFSSIHYICIQFWYKMTEEDKKLLNTFEGKLRHFMYLYEEQQKENASLRQLLAEKEVEIAELQNSRKELEAMYTNLKTARIISINDNELRDTKQRLAKLVREVDKCIALLNE